MACATRGWAAPILILWLAFGCGPGGSAPETVGPEPIAASLVSTADVPAPADADEAWDRLGACPAGDRDWFDGLVRARQTGRLDDFRERMQQVAERCPGMWQPAWSVAQAHYFARQFDEATDWSQRAYDLAREKADPIGVAWAGYRLGWMRLRRGELETAEAVLKQALDDARGQARHDLAGTIANAQARVVLERGRLAESRDFLELATNELQQAPGEQTRAQVISITFNQAVHTLRLGDARRAETALRQILEEIDTDHRLRPSIALTLGNLYRRTRRFDDAREWYAEVPDGDSRIGGTAQLARGLLDLAEGRFGDAGVYFDAAVEQATSEPERELASVYRLEADRRAAGRPDLAGIVPAFRASIERSDGADWFDPRWIGRWLLARAHVAAGDDAAAIAQLREAVAMLEEKGDTLDPLHDGMRYLVERKEPYAELASLLAARGAAGAEELLQVLEATHARALRRAFGQAVVPREVDLRQVVGSLGDKSAIIDFVLGEEAGAVLVLTAEGPTAVPLPGWDRLREPLRRYRAALQRPLHSAEARLDPEADWRRSAETGRALSTLLLGPIRAVLEPLERLYWVADGELALVPPAALPWADGFLGERFEIALLPTTGAGVAPDLAPGGPALLAGDPLADANGEWPRLARARSELASLKRLYGGDAMVLEGRDLDVEDFRALPLQQFRTLHLATHAEASTNDPSRCAVRMSRGEPLGLDRIERLPLDDALVVLSACRSGDGEVVAGEGVVGLSWAFLRAGAAAVTASLWSVEDGAAAELMIRYHEALRDHDPVTALSLAQRGIAAERPHPAYWAPFVTVLRPAS